MSGAPFLSFADAAAACRSYVAEMERMPWVGPDEVAFQRERAERFEQAAAMGLDIPRDLFLSFGADHMAYLLTAPIPAGTVASRQAGAWDCNDPEGFESYGRLLDIVRGESAEVRAGRGKGWRFYPRPPA